MAPWLAGALLVLAIAAAYLPVRHAGFIWDDDAHLTANRCIVGPFGLKEIWTTAEANYFPLVLTHLWVWHALVGLNPLPYHLLSVLLHAASAVLLWQVLRQIGVRGAWLGAALWALHPVQVESVAWISELKNTQSAVFYLLAIWLFLRWRATTNASGVNRDYVLAVVCAVLAILSKPSTVMLPVALGLCWWWLNRDWRWRDVRWLVPFLVVSAVASGWTIWEQKVHSKASGAEWSQTWPERAIIAGRAVWFYLGKLAWPHPLVFVYPRWTIDAASLLAWLAPVTALGGLGGLAGVRNQAGRAALFAAAYFVATLFPVLGFFSVYYFRYSFVADHFQYLASMGICALAGAGAVTWLSRTTSARAATVGLGAVLIVLALRTQRECHTYADNLTLWQTTAARNPAAWIAHNNLGLELGRAGRTAEAHAHYERALLVNPNAPEVHTNYGNSLFRADRAAEAIGHFETALRLKPDQTEAHNSLSVIHELAGRIPEAIAHAEAALRLHPGYPEAHFNLGNALQRARRWPEAIESFRRAIQFKPGFTEAINNLGGALFAAGRFQEAIAPYTEFLRLQPDNAEAHNNLAGALYSVGRVAEGVGHYETALKLRPDYVQAHTNLAIVLAASGAVPAAIVHYEAALRLSPGDAGLRAAVDALKKQLPPPR